MMKCNAVGIAARTTACAHSRKVLCALQIGEVRKGLDGSAFGVCGSDAFRRAAQVRRFANIGLEAGNCLDGLKSISSHEVNLPDVVAEVADMCSRYERALCANDVNELDALFLDSEFTLRYGTAENLYGYEAIRQFRSGRAPPGEREVLRTTLTTYGRDFAIDNREFRRAGDPAARLGRQSQTWLRTPKGWKVITAHVSWMDVQGSPAGKPQ